MSENIEESEAKPKNYVQASIILEDQEKFKLWQIIELKDRFVDQIIEEMFTFLE